MICISSMILWMMKRTSLPLANRILIIRLPITISTAHGPSNRPICTTVPPNAMNPNPTRKRSKWNSIIIIVSVNIPNWAGKCINLFGNTYIIWEYRIKNKSKKLISSSNFKSIINARSSPWSGKVAGIAYPPLPISYKGITFGNKISYKK